MPSYINKIKKVRLIKAHKNTCFPKSWKRLSIPNLHALTKIEQETNIIPGRIVNVKLRMTDL